MTDRPPAERTRGVWESEKDPLEQMGELLWGGPAGKGLVYAVDELRGAVEGNAEVLQKHTDALFGNGKRGIYHKVELHGEFIDRFKDSQKWALRLLTAQLLAILIAGGAFVLKVVIGG